MNAFAIAALPVEYDERTFIELTGDRAFREFEPVTERNAVIVIVKHWTENSYLALRRIDKTRAFVTGGIHPGEMTHETAIREVVQETGYTNVLPWFSLVHTVHDKFYHIIKNQNRHAHSKIVFCQLADGYRIEVSNHERQIQEAEWVESALMKPFLNIPSHRYAWELFQETFSKRA